MKKTFADQFLSACGAEQPLRVSVIKAGESSTENWVFPRPYLVIGRRADSDLVLDHWQISRRHAYIQYLDGSFHCFDLASRTGTHGGGGAIARSGWIPRNQSIRVGPYEVRPILSPRVPDLSRRTAENLPGVVWELPQRAVGSAVWRMDGQMILVGRSPSCQIRLIEKDVSKFHCSLVRTRWGVWVVDLLGQNGVFVNDEPARCAWLDDGDEVRIGRHILRPRYDTNLPALIDSTPPLQRQLPPPGPIEAASASLPTRFGVFSGVGSPTRVAVPAPAMLPAGLNLDAILEDQGQGRSLAPVVSAMVEQFGQMQHQMFEQFHNMMLAMFDGFAAMHREQSEAMREEMEQVRKLSREIELLQAETERLQARSKDQGRETAVGPHASPTSPPFSGPSTATAGPPPASPGVATTGKPKRTTPNAGVSPADGDLHAQLALRLASIHSERQGRWQKILGMMSSQP